MSLEGQRVLVFGTDGAQGVGLVPALLRNGAVPVRATSRPQRAEQWRAAGEASVVADLADAGSVLAAAEQSGASAVAGHIPLALGPAAPDAVASYVALRSADLPVTVNIGAPVAAPGTPDPFGSRAVADALLAAGATVLTPTGYLENHAAPWALAALARGELIYPRPALDVLAWIAAGDLGRAAVAALDRGILGERLVLAGPEALTFEQLAATVGAVLDRPVRFVQVSPSEYATQLRPFVGEQAAAGVEAAYGAMPPTSNPAFDPPEAAATWQRLGLAPTSARQWATSVLRPALAGLTVGQS